jgi:hypothetical protein
MNSLRRLVCRLPILFLVITGTSNAQVAEKKALTLEEAKKVIAAAEAYARQNNAPAGVIAVVDDGGNLIALERLHPSKYSVFLGRLHGLSSATVARSS